MNPLEKNPVMPKQNLSPVPEDTAFAPGIGSLRHIVDPQSPSRSLDYLRAEFPFLSIMLFPPSVVTVVCDIGGQAYNLDVPDGAIIGCFKGNGNYYVSKNGNAAIPTTALPGSSLFKPEYSWFALSGVKQFSVISPDAGTIVQLHSYVKL